MPTISAEQLAVLVGGRLTGDGARELRAIAPLESATETCVSFLSNARYAQQLNQTGAGVVLVARGTVREGGDYIETTDPYGAFVTVLEFFHPSSGQAAGVHPSAVIAASARVGKNVSIGPQCVIENDAVIGDGAVLLAQVYVGSGAEIGEGTYLHSHVSVCHGCRLGRRVIIHCGTVIGSDGFGFAPDQGRFRKIPQVGIVVIEDDVEIGANTTVDRATMGETRIGQGTKIDNLVQIAHNVKIGKHCVIAAQAGISGSTQMGDYCRVGGQAGFIGHIKIGDGAAFGAQSGIAGDVGNGEILSGSPGRPHGLWKRIEAAIPRLPELLRRVRRIEEHLGISQSSKEERVER
ncbi:MAG: UDP-3-O-(3-hydroxymyristoyl)glucosamine N-acyltransferase [bacterium]|nr:UDP-3-O-(3-hydroxymyristoyl)glucosamine N-acyltransferase [bacterium]